MDRLKQEDRSLLNMELDGQEGKEPRDSREPSRPEVPRDDGRVEEPADPEDVDVVVAPGEARSVERPSVSRDVSVVRVSEENRVETPPDERRRVRRVGMLQQIQEAGSGEESEVSGEISELVVSKSKRPGRLKEQWKNRQHELAEEEDNQEEKERDLKQVSHEEEPYEERTKQHYPLRSAKHMSIDTGMLDRRKSQGKYRLEKKPNLQSFPKPSAPVSPSLARRWTVDPRVPLVPRVPQISVVPGISLAPQVSLVGPSTLKTSESPLGQRRPTIRFSRCHRSSPRLSQGSAVPCISLYSAFNELAKLGDPNLLEMVEEEGRTAGRR